MQNNNYFLKSAFKSILTGSSFIKRTRLSDFAAAGINPELAFQGIIILNSERIKDDLQTFINLIMVLS
jgi:hypothetical protein